MNDNLRKRRAKHRRDADDHSSDVVRTDCPDAARAAASLSSSKSRSSAPTTPWTHVDRNTTDPDRVDLTDRLGVAVSRAVRRVLQESRGATTLLIRSEIDRIEAVEVILKAIKRTRAGASRHGRA